MKHYSERSFKITKDLTANAWTEDTRYGFRHLITLDKTYSEIASNKACYYNRTWEGYEYESVLKGLIEKSEQFLTAYELKTFKSKVKNGFRKAEAKRVDQQFSTLGMVMAMGDLLAGDSQKSKNDWKTRMLKAGLGNQGLIMPEDWDTLSEDVKTARLDGITKQFLNK